MRGGLTFESKRLSDWMETKAEWMDSVFNFQPIMIKGGVVPPVLTETTEACSSTNGNLKKVADVVYKIDGRLILRARRRTGAPMSSSPTTSTPTMSAAGNRARTKSARSGPPLSRRAGSKGLSRRTKSSRPTFLASLVT